MNAHRLNYHDILVLESVKARCRAQADANHRADRVVVVGTLLCFAALMVLQAIGWLA